MPHTFLHRGACNSARSRSPATPMGQADSRNARAYVRWDVQSLFVQFVSGMASRKFEYDVPDALIIWIE